MQDARHAGDETSMKVCSKCGVEKNFQEFYPVWNRPNGSWYSSACKECCRADARKKYRADPSFRQRCLETASRVQKDNPKKYGAHKNASRRRMRSKAAVRQLTQRVINDGRLTRRPCEKCGAKAQAHHDDYKKPLDVRWLCPKHHGEHHRNVRDER